MARTPRTPRKSAAEKPESPEVAELRAQLDAQQRQMQALLDAHNASSTQSAALSQLLSAIKPVTPTPTGTLMVGIRNVSNNTIGIGPSPMPGEGYVTLNAPGELPDPHTVAVISYVWWQQLRRSSFYGNGLFVRDDTVLGPAHQSAPADAPHEVHPDHAKNVVLDPVAFIEGQSELEVRERIKRMTSEQSLRRLLAAVDRQVYLQGLKYDRSDPERGAKAVMDLPSIYELVEKLCERRLQEIAQAVDESTLTDHIGVKIPERRV